MSTPGPGGSKVTTCGVASPGSAPTQRVTTCACGELSASSSGSSPAATISSASESSRVSRCAVSAAGVPGAGDSGAGDSGARGPGAGAPGAGDSGAGDPGAGDPVTGAAGAASQYARLSPSQQSVAAEPVITAETNVADPIPPGDLARPATAASADRTAAEDASVRSVPSCAAVRSTSAAAWAAASEASAGRMEVDTPSQTTATRTGPSAAGTTASSIASSFWRWRRPRSVTPAIRPRSISW